MESLRAEIAGWAGKEATEPPRRQAAVEALVDLGGPPSIKTLEVLSAADRPYGVRLQAIEGLASLNVKQAARLAGNLLKQPPPAGIDPAPLFGAFLRQKGGSLALAGALKESRPSVDAAKIGLRVVVGLGSPAPELTAVLHASAGQSGQQRKFDAVEIKRLLALVPAADPHRGEAVFRRPTLGCLQCHAIGGAGGRVGPDLSGIGTSAQLDYLLESIVLPSKIIREGYTTAHVSTKNGTVISGIVQRDTPKELVLRDPVRGDIIIPQADIEEKTVGGSLMPNGLDLSLTDGELADLTRFLSELGKPGPFGVQAHVRVARRWQVLTSSPESLSLLDDAALGKALREDARLAWAPAYSQVSGQLPLAEVPGSLGKNRKVLRCQIDVVTPGKVTLGVGSSQGLRVWLDGTPVKVQDAMTLPLERGLHTITIVVDTAARNSPALRCELLDAAGSSAQARFVDGS
jgi:putative heme-binding domain-containing protein